MHLYWLLTAGILCIPSPANPFFAFARVFRICCTTGSSRVAVANYDIRPEVPLKTNADQRTAIPDLETPFIDALPQTVRTVSFSFCPDPQHLFTSAWKLFKVLPAKRGDRMNTGTNIEDAQQRFEFTKILFDPTGYDGKQLLVNGKILGPRENVILLTNQTLGDDSRWLFPANLRIPFAAHVNIWNLLDSGENGVKFHLDNYGDEVGAFTSTIQLHGHRTYLFYTKRNLIEALVAYKNIRIMHENLLPKFPLHHTLEALGISDFETNSRYDYVPRWYAKLKMLNRNVNMNGLPVFPDHLMPMEVTIGPGEILVFDGSMIHGTLNSEDKKPSVALFG